jgi:hypothetical protein
VRAAACICLAFLASHPLDAKGNECMSGPHRGRLLAAGGGMMRPNQRFAAC